jgi:RNA polymerase sigma-70 factor (ECF subfamily)
MVPDESTDAELATRIAAHPRGEARDAEAELCRRLAPRIRLFALRWLRDEQAAADVVQRVLLVALERLRAGAVREPERLASFVLGVCRMTLRDGLKHARRTERVLDEYARSIPDAESPRTAGLDRGRLADCLARLAERERSVVVMTFFVERTTDEIVDDLAISAGNVRVIRHRALARLRACLEGAP